MTDEPVSKSETPVAVGDKSPKQLADQMLADLRRGKSLHDMFAEAVSNRIKLGDKTMNEWLKHFRIAIPETPDTSQCKEIDMKLMELHQEASFMKAMAEASHTLGQKSKSTQYREKFTSLVSQYSAGGKKLPAKDTLETLAMSELDDIDSGLSFSEMAIKFWKDIIEDLNFKRKIIETATIANASEVKLLMYGRNDPSKDRDA